MIALEVGLAVLVAAGALWLIAWPLFRPLVAASGWEDLPDPEETRKGVALLALREIEFDRETGKLSDVDYDRLKQSYTSEALAALRVEEGKAARAPEAVESLIAARVLQLSAGGSAPLCLSASASQRCPSCGTHPPEPDAIFCSNCGLLLASDGCAKCGAALRPDSKFCESCGTPVAGAA
ncbi:MAG: zinc ribbon domain-containing protein [Gemmatimonadales bacterium]